jgi:hypothetical protein
MLTVAYELANQGGSEDDNAASSQHERIVGYAEWRRAGNGWERVRGV